MSVLIEANVGGHPVPVKGSKEARGLRAFYRKLEKIGEDATELPAYLGYATGPGELWLKLAMTPKQALAWAVENLDGYLWSISEVEEEATYWSEERESWPRALRLSAERKDAAWRKR